MFWKLRLPPPEPEQLDIAAQRVLCVPGPPSWRRILVERVEWNAAASAAGVVVIHGETELAEPGVGDEEEDCSCTRAYDEREVRVLVLPPVRIEHVLRRRAGT